MSEESSRDISAKLGINLGEKLQTLGRNAPKILSLVLSKRVKES